MNPLNHRKAAIIDYGMGNLASVKKALDFLKIENIITQDHQKIKESDYLILPGVGSFKQGMENLEALGLESVLTQQVLVHKKPILGICLGMQLMASKGTEPSEHLGLNWIGGTVEKINSQNLRVPHLGWNSVDFQDDALNDVSGLDYYFIHSYHFNILNKAQILGTVSYGQELVSAIKHENIWAVQFHPEKSQMAGLNFLAHFFNYYAKN